MSISSVNYPLKLGGNDSFIPTEFKNPAWDESKDYAATLECMEKGSLVYSCDMRDFLSLKGKKARFHNEVHYGILRYENSYVAIAYKPKKTSEISAAYAEKVAYDISEKLLAPFTGRHIVPPTIVRKMPDGRIASCQFFVETCNEEDMWNEEFRNQVFERASQDVIQEMSIYNAVFNNWDRHPGNYLATQRDGCFYLASIDNEAIENKGILLNWGERSYIPVFFTEDSRASKRKEIKFSKDITLSEFKVTLGDHGFKEVPRMKNIFNKLVARGDSSRSLVIDEGVAAIAYHQGNLTAFPLPTGPYSQNLIKAYSRLNKQSLDECYRPLVELDPDRFGNRVFDVLARRDMFLQAVQMEKKFKDLMLVLSSIVY